MDRAIAIAVSCVAVFASCSNSPPPERIDATLTIDGRGISAPLVFEVPDGTRSLTMVAQGAPDSLLAIASLSLADGRELVEIPVDGSHRAQMEEQYFQEQVGAMPGSLYQSIRLGTFTHVYPHAPGQLLPPGPAVLEIASTATSGSVDVSLLMPPDDGGSILHAN